MASLLISALVTEHLSNSGAQPTSSLQLTTSSATLLSAKGNLDPRPYYLLRWVIAPCKHYLIDQAFVVRSLRFLIQISTYTIVWFLGSVLSAC